MQFYLKHLEQRLNTYMHQALYVLQLELLNLSMVGVHHVIFKFIFVCRVLCWLQNDCTGWIYSGDIATGCTS